MKTLTHSQQQPQGPKTQKKANNQTDNQNQCSVTTPQSMETQHNVLFHLFLFIIVSRENELLCL